MVGKSCGTGASDPVSSEAPVVPGVCLLVWVFFPIIVREVKTGKVDGKTCIYGGKQKFKYYILLFLNILLL